MSLLNNDFEGKLRESMEHYELPYEHSRWTAFEKQLNLGRLTDFSWLVAAASTLVVLLSASALIYVNVIRDERAVQSYVQPRFEDYTPVSTIKAVDHSITGKRSELTHADLLLFPEVEPLSRQAREKVAADNRTAESNDSVNTRNANTTVRHDDSTVQRADRTSAPIPMGVNVSVSNACAGTEVEFGLKNGPDKGSYLWNFGDGNFSNKAQPSHRYDKPGVFDVSLSVTDQNGRITTNIMSGLVTISPAPTADFTWDFVESSSETPSVKIINTSENASRFNWKFDSGQTSTNMNPSISLLAKGRQMVVLEVANEFGCTDSKVKYISVNHDYNLQAAEKIRIGKDVFMPEALKSGRMNFKMKIFSSDQVIYETSNRNKGWDGHLPGGVLAQSGQTFEWIVIIYNDSTKEEKFFNGVVTAVNP